MANFWDLPRPLRDNIYRLHLLHDGLLTAAKHDKMITFPRESSRCVRKMPPICLVSSQTEREAAPIYYGENHFCFTAPGCGGFDTIYSFKQKTYPRLFKLVRKLTFLWHKPTHAWGGGYGQYGHTRDDFLKLAAMKGLQELNIGVDEADMLRDFKVSRETCQRPNGADLTPQQQLAILRFPAMTGLLAITNVPNVNFVKMVDEQGESYGGPVPNGALLTQILPRLRPKPKLRRVRRKGIFRFLDLPPELRNRVYDMLLHLSGPVHPSTELPTSAPRDENNIKINESEHHESALSLLAVNKQVNAEAMGAFYRSNAFLFHYPAQLHAFLLCISPQRQGLLCDLTIHYYNVRSGGVDGVDLTFPMLKQLTGLRRLRVLMVSHKRETVLRRGWYSTIPHWDTWGSWLKACNPGLIPGMKHLFQLRGITDIMIKDLELDKDVEKLRTEPGYPTFSGDRSKLAIMQLSRAYAHFNKALVDAQTGKVNWELLEDNSWHIQDDLPTLESESSDGDEWDVDSELSEVETTLFEARIEHVEDGSGLSADESELSGDDSGGSEWGS